MMAKEAEGITPSFRQCVAMRYKKDTIITWFVTLIVVTLPLILMGIIKMLILVGPSSFDPLAKYEVMIQQIITTIELSMIMAIMYNMYTRLRTHSQRDRPWRKSLIVFANRMGANTEELSYIDERICRREHFALTSIIVLLMVAMFCYCVYLFIAVAPLHAYYVVEEAATAVYAEGLIIALALCLVQFVLIILKVLTFPYKHERRQCEFTLELSKCLGEVGITIPPMIKIVKHHNILFHLFFLIITAGIYSIWLVISIFKGMNHHLINQWSYEEEMLRVVESDGREVFHEYMPDYFADSQTDKKQYDRLAKRNKAQVRSHVKRENKMPASLIIAELFLVVLCANYILKIVALECEISNNYSDYIDMFKGVTPFLDTLQNLQPKQIMDLVMIPVDLLMITISISALLGIASRRTSSWRKVTRTCITFVIPLWLSFIGLTNVSGLTHIFDFNVYITTIVLMGVFLMMLFSSSIKEFYSPVGEEVPGIASWFRYIFVGNLEGKGDEIAVIDDVPDH